MGVYKGGTKYYHNISENISTTSKFYDYSDGYFGKKSKKRDNYVRIIESSNPLKTSRDFYNKISYGGEETPLSNGKGTRTSTEDGTIITYRSTSSSDGSPAIDINIEKSTNTGGLKKQKIHFVEVKKKWK